MIFLMPFRFQNSTFSCNLSFPLLERRIYGPNRGHVGLFFMATFIMNIRYNEAVFALSALL